MKVSIWMFALALLAVAPAAHSQVVSQPYQIPAGYTNGTVIYQYYSGYPVPVVYPYGSYYVYPNMGGYRHDSYVPSRRSDQSSPPVRHHVRHCGGG
jgi:hypothetical protein